MLAAGMLILAMAAQARPAVEATGLEPIQAEMERRCRSMGGRPMFVPDAISGGDLNHDGQPDYLLSAQGFACQRRGIDANRFPPDNGYCTPQLCQNWLSISGPDGRRRLVWQGMGFQCDAVRRHADHAAQAELPYGRLQYPAAVERDPPDRGQAAAALTSAPTARICNGSVSDC